MHFVETSENNSKSRANPGLPICWQQYSTLCSHILEAKGKGTKASQAVRLGVSNMSSATGVQLSAEKKSKKVARKAKLLHLFVACHLH